MPDNAILHYPLCREFYDKWKAEEGNGFPLQEATYFAAKGFSLEPGGHRQVCQITMEDGIIGEGYSNVLWGENRNFAQVFEAQAKAHKEAEYAVAMLEGRSKYRLWLWEQDLGKIGVKAVPVSLTSQSYCLGTSEFLTTYYAGSQRRNTKDAMLPIVWCELTEDNSRYRARSYAFVDGDGGYDSAKKTAYDRAVVHLLADKWRVEYNAFDENPEKQCA